MYNDVSKPIAYNIDRYKDRAKVVYSVMAVVRTLV
jgi:hypothetical protein